MRPVPIPKERIWEGTERRVITGPDGDLTGEVRPVEALIDVSDKWGPRFHILIRVDERDLEALKDDPHFWITWYGNHLHAFSVAGPLELAEQDPDDS